MRISERGQVTIPQAIREQFGLLPNTDVEFLVKDGSVRLVPSPSARRKAVNALYGSHQFELPTNELMKLLRE